MKYLVLGWFIVSSIWVKAQSDNCATATVINLDATGNACVTGTTANATSSNTFYGTCNPNPNANNEVWYTYIADGSVNSYTITPQGFTNPEIVIYTGGCAGILQTCNTANGTGVLTTNIGLPAGTQVWLGVMSNQGTQGGFQLCVSSTVPDPAGGNTCAGAVPLCDKFAPFTIDMTNITPSGDWPDCFGSAMNNDVWFSFTATQTGTLEFQVTPTGVGANGVELDWALYDATALGGCPNTGGSGSDPTYSCNYNYDGGNGAPSGMEAGGTGEFNPAVNLIAGNTYYLVVDYYTGGGTGTMYFEFLPGMTAEIAPFVDFTVTPSQTCAASLNAVITNNSFGGTPTWNYGDGSPTYTGNTPPAHNYTTPGTYAITATIPGVCNSFHSEFVQLFAPVVSTPSPIDETCLGDCDGSISLNTTGGSGQYSYLWAPGGQTTPSISNQCDGNYSVTITDAVCGNIVENIVLNPGPDCSLPCSIDNFTANIGACENPLNVYDLSGAVTFSNAPASGTLTVTACDGTNQVFNAPFTSPQAYTLNNLPANSAACSVTAVFSADAACTQTINFTNPAPCDVPCAFTSIADTVGACDLVTNDFIRSGQVTFTNAPSTGTLTLSDCLGNTQTFNAPFTSPTSYSLTINSNGTANCDITATFSADPACTINIAQSYPVSCACPADAGTSSAGVFGNGLNDYILCSGDTIIIVSDGNETNPNDVGVIGASTYDPGITYGIYSCPPTANTNPELDACFTGFITGTIGSFGDINDGGLLAFLAGQGVTLTNNIIYYAPITLYNQTDFVYNVNCVDVGLPVAVQYLPQVTSSAPTENCAAGTFTVTINGGLPQLNGSNFTASNLLPVTASFVNTTTTNGGTIQISGLQHGDNYSFDVADANGCPITITGGPFTGAPVADAGQADTSCTLTYALNATLSHGTGLWTGPANISFSNATSPTATATSTTAGTYTLTWTGTSLPGCTDVSTVNITFLNPITTVVVPDCQDSSVTVTISNGLPEQNGSNYIVSNLLPATAMFTTSVATHGGDVVAQGFQNGDMYSFDITDDFGCTTSITGGPFVGLPLANAGQNDTSCTLTYNLNATPSIGTGLWTGPANISFSNATSPTATATSTTAGTYTLTWTETNTPGCTDVATVNITFTQMSIPNVLTHVTCNGGTNGQVVVAPQGGIVPYSYAWSTSSNTTPVENNLSAGNVTVTVTDGAGCTLDSTFTLTQPAAFNVTIANITQVTCNGGNNGQATANVSDVTTTYTYSWNTTPVQATATATGLTIGTYTVTATQALSGCTDTAMVTITQPTAVTIATVSPNITICSGQSTTITATATGGSNSGYTYTWDNGLGNGQNQTVTPAANTTTTYQVSATDANGCPSDTQDVVVTVHPNLSVIASADDTICPGASATISATPSFGNGGPYTYTWTPNTNISSTTAQSPTVTPITNTTYTVTLSDGCSPTVTDQVTISLYNLPNPQATADTLSLCIRPSQPITFYNTTDTTNGMLNPAAVVWDFGDGATSTSPWDTISHTYTQPGTYAVSMTVSSMPEQGGCTVTQTVIPQINIYALPVADFTSNPNPTSMFEPEVQFADQSGSTIAIWHWDFAGLDTSNYPNPLYAFPDDTLGNYPITLTVTDIHGCQDEVTKNVIVKGEFGLYIPNAFTPDFDFKNDMFGPTGFGISPEDYRFMIFDRWGEKLFDTDILFKPWDGTYKGTRVQEGVYVWKLFFKDINKKKHERIGHVTIIQ